MSGLYRIFNEGEIDAFGAGWRSVIALAPGRKWITLVEWTTLDVTRLSLDQWRRLRPRPATGYSPRRVRAAIRLRLRYARMTRTIAAAAALVK